MSIYTDPGFWTTVREVMSFIVPIAVGAALVVYIGMDDDYGLLVRAIAWCIGLPILVIGYIAFMYWLTIVSV